MVPYPRECASPPDWPQPWWRNSDTDAINFYRIVASKWGWARKSGHLVVTYNFVASHLPPEIGNMFRLDGWGERWLGTRVVRPTEYFKNYFT